MDPFGGGETPAPRPPSTPQAPEPTIPPQPPGEGLAVGLTETNAGLLANPEVSPSPAPGAAGWRDRLTALRPRYFRLMVDWAVLQPDPAQPANLEQSRDGCSRGHQPCVPTSGVRDVLRSVRMQQQAAGGFDVFVVIYGVPDWAAQPANGCERPDAAPRSRPIADAAMPAYRQLIRAIAAVGEAEKVPIRWWAPWNEANGPFFVSPQRAACDTSSPLLSPAVYTKLARAMREELTALPGEQDMTIGELAGLPRSSLRGGGIEEFFAGLPDDVVCSAKVFTQHAYAEPGDADAATRPVDDLEAALAKRPCAADQPIWITETGVGGPKVGGRREGGDAGLRADCRAMDAALRRWDIDPRIQAAFQYTFRDDPAFPVGLANARLTRTWPTYDLWKAWGGNREPAAPPPALPDSCADAVG